MASLVSVQQVEAELKKLGKKHRKKEKAYRHIKTLEAKNKAGEKLEKNQLIKLQSGLKTQLEKELLEFAETRQKLLLAASVDVRERVGVCGKCCSFSHETKECPRRNIVTTTRAKSKHEKPAKSHFQRRVKEKPTPNIPGLQAHVPETKARSRSSTPRVLCVAEKPSIARTLASCMSYGKNSNRSPQDQLAPMCKLHDFFAIFPPADKKSKSSIVATSVLGHVMSTDFDSRDNCTVSPETLFRARTVKQFEESTVDLGIAEHLIAAADDCDYLYLWLDCDNEGENICFEIIKLLQVAGYFLDESKIYRAYFSSLTEKALRYAFANPRRARKSLSDSVDARQELDLKIGVTFTRLLTSEFTDGAKITFKIPKLKLISYGPCQTPTLGFCVKRLKEREKFIPRRFWEVHLNVEFRANTPKGVKVQCIDMEWGERNGRSFAQKTANMALAVCQKNIRCVVKSVKTRQQRVSPPPGLNTVQMLRAASLSMGLSPKKTMEVAEKLYMAGYITYPRTESTRYSLGMDFLAIVRSLVQKHGSIDMCKSVLTGVSSEKQTNVLKLPRSGVDKGDHPPITPTTKVMSRSGFGWQLYEFICRSFLGSLMPPLMYSETLVTVNFKKNKPTFSCKTNKIIKMGWAGVMPWRLKAMRLNTEADVSFVAVNMKGHVKSSSVSTGKTEPPQFLKEYELIDAMDQNGIGTDASIPTHVDTIIKRGYCNICDSSGKHIEGDSTDKKVRNAKQPSNTKPSINTVSNASGEGRFMVPTKLGVALIDCFQTTDAELCQPTIRAHMENELTAIAKEEKTKEEVLEKNLQNYFLRFRAFAKALDSIRPLFITEETVYELLRISEEKLSRGGRKKLSNMSDYEIRKMEEEEHRLSGIISQLEKIRMESSRTKNNPVLRPEKNRKPRGRKR